MSSTAAAGVHVQAAATSQSNARWAPVTGIAFVIFFVAGVLSSSPPNDDVSNAKWIADYTGRSNQAGHVLTGVFLVLAGLSLLSFIAVLWTRIARASRPGAVNPLPLLAAGVSAACIALGGILMAAVSGSILLNSGPVPAADLLRFANDTGFAMAGIAGMLAAALSVGLISLQARGAGIFGRKLTALGLATALVLLASFAFIPILALLIWLLAASVTLMRAPNAS
jgi:hypothetical protein